jgi:hypothetical protein
MGIPVSARHAVVELVGPAGAGKSTFANQICARNALVLGPFSMWGLPRAALIGAALRLAPAWIAATLRRRAPRLEAMGHMIRVEALRRVVDRAARRGIVLLDEGPLFGLMRLDVFFPANGDAFTAAWRDRTCRYWAQRLDAVIVLDAANRTLAQRIRTRDKHHDYKSRTPPEIYEFTERYRRVMHELVQALRQAGAVRVWTMRTDEPPGDASAAAMVEQLETAHG